MRHSPAALIRQADMLSDWLKANTVRPGQDHDKVSAADTSSLARERIAATGVGAIRVPAESGGVTGSMVDLLRVMIAMARGNADIALSLIPHFLSVERHLLHSLMAEHAESEAQLRRVGSGELIVEQPRDVSSFGALSIASDLLHASVDMGITHAALAEAAGWVREGVRPVKESGVSRAEDDPFILHTLGRVQAHAQAAEALLMAAARSFQKALDHYHDRNAAEKKKSDANAASNLSVGARSVSCDFAAVAANAAEAAALTGEIALLAGQTIFDVGGASTTLRKRGFDRHWRAARRHSLRDPLDHHYRSIGEYRLSENCIG